MDAFSLALIYGTQGIPKKHKLLLAMIVGLYHLIMPLIGLTIGKYIENRIIFNSTIVVGIILSLIAIEMIISSFKEKKEKFLISIPGYLIFGLSVSIDSLTTGIGLPAITNKSLLASSIFSIISFIFTYLGLNLGNILNKKYGIMEIDFLSSELEIVPAMRCRTMGFDESMVAGYGQDDKVCVYTSLTALVDMKEIPEKTSVCIIADKEEIGSMGNTGMESHAFDNFIAEILNKLGVNRPNLLEKIFCNSKMLSADVDAGLDPIYANVSERNNASYLGRGIGINKYTGSRGKAGASDANAEFVAEVRNIFEKENIKYQISELGKVDTGGGGTIAYILANKGIDVIDCGVPVLSMHSPYEVTSKIDIYEAYRAYKAFWTN